MISFKHLSHIKKLPWVKLEFSGWLYSNFNYIRNNLFQIKAPLVLNGIQSLVFTLNAICAGQISCRAKKLNYDPSATF